MTKKTRLGKTDIYVNPIGLGTNAVGGHNIFPNLDDETGKEIVRTALDHGINFWIRHFITVLSVRKKLSVKSSRSLAVVMK